MPVLPTLLLGMLLLPAGGCMHFTPDLDRQAETRDLPPDWPVEAPPAQSNDLAIDRYWLAFESPELERLVTAVLARNHDLLAAQARVRQAGYGARVAWSERFPLFTYDAEVSWSENRSDSDVRGNGAEWTRQLGVAASYEVDLWGRVRALHRGELEDLAAAEFDWRTAQMTLTAETVLRWIDLRSARAQLALLDSQAQALNRITNLLEGRYRQGDASRSDILAQQQTLATIEERRALARQAEATAIAELRLLGGGNDLALDGEPTGALPEPLPLPPAGLPGDLLERRPDVQAAWRRVQAGAWRASSADAARLPTLNLGGSFFYTASGSDPLFENSVATAFAGLTGPLFDFQGRKYAALEADAATEAALHDFRHTLRESIRDVERALSANRFLQRRYAAAQSRADISRERAELLNYRYRNGITPYLDVYIAELDRIAAEQNALTAQTDLLLQRVQLVRALGGGWPRTPSEQTGEDEQTDE